MKILILVIVNIALIPMPLYIWAFETSKHSQTKRKLYASCYFACFLAYMAFAIYQGLGKETAGEFLAQVFFLIWILFGSFQFIRVWQAIQ